MVGLTTTLFPTETTAAGRFQGGNVETPPRVRFSRLVFIHKSAPHLHSLRLSSHLRPPRLQVLAAGVVDTAAYNPDPYSIQNAIRSASYTPDAALTAQYVCTPSPSCCRRAPHASTLTSLPRHVTGSSRT